MKDYKKLYEEALKKAKENKPLTEIFSELKESEDEKIRMELIEALKQLDREKTPVDTYPYFEWVSWLEKQGEQKPAIAEDKGAEKAAEEYRNFRMSCGITDPIMLDEIEEAYYSGMTEFMKGAKELVVDELDWHIYHFALGCLGVASGDRVKVVVIKQE